MVEKVKILPCDIVDFARYQAGRNANSNAPAIPARACRHCGAALLDGESEDECSSAFNADVAGYGGKRKLFAD